MIWLIPAAIWAIFAAMQVCMPGHVFDPVWFGVDVFMAVFFAMAAGFSMERRP